MEDVKKIRIKYFTDKIDRLAYIGGKSDWIDLRCAEEIQMKAPGCGHAAAEGIRGACSSPEQHL